jgi:hypothetical protein
MQKERMKKDDSKTNEDKEKTGGQQKINLEEYAGDEQDNSSAKEQASSYINDLDGKGNETDTSKRETG